MDAISVLLRTVLVYFFVHLMIRIMGKREIGKLSVFDLVISVLISDLAVLIVEDTATPIWQGVLPVGVLVVLQISIAFLSLKYRKLRDWFDGRPSVIIDQGKINRKEMRKQRYSLDDLLVQLRESNVNNVADVEFAILEPTGKLSVTTRQEYQNEKSDQSPSGQPSNGKPAFRYEGLPIPLIMDGKVIDQNLERIGQNRFWLKNELQNRGVASVKEVFLCTLDHRGRLFIDKKD